MRYTPAQTRWFLQAIDELERDRHQVDVIGARAAQATQKALQEYFAAIKSGS